MNAMKESGQTRDKIIAVAGEYFFKNGHRSITMDALADMIGVSKKTIYVYFPTKVAILEAVMNKKFELIFTTLENTRKAHEANTVECFLAVLERWQELLSYVAPVFWHDIQKDVSSFLESSAERRRKIIQGIFGRIIRDGIAQHDFRSDMNPEFVADIILASIEGILRSVRCTEYNISPRELLLTLVRLIVEGSLTDSGREKWMKTDSPVKTKINPQIALS
jgi:AcrR family transcriptional regulator